jgi:hypothetical protein
MKISSFLSLTALASLFTGVTATAQLPEYLLTYSQTEATVSGSGGTVLASLRPNEICQLRANSVTCPSLSAEKWMPRTAANVMAGDEDANGQYDNVSIFGRIDALLASQPNVAGVVGDNQRTVFWSPSQAMGNAISASPFRPGDVGRIIRNGVGEGQVQYFMRMELFTQALGMPAGSMIDIDAIAFSPNYGVFFSLDTDTVAIIDCGPTLVRDGDVLCVPAYGLSYTPDMRIASVMPSSAIVVHSELQMNAFTTNAQVTNRFGGCVSVVVDVESLEIDFSGPSTLVSSCSGASVPVPTLLFSTETGTGASVLSTQFGGQIHNIPCGPAGTSCGFGPTSGAQMGIRPTSLTVGASSFVNALSFSRACRSVLQPQQHTMNVWPLGAPAGAIQIDYNSDFAFNIALIEIVSPVIPGSVLASPWSQLCFPSLYAPSISVHAWPLAGPFGSFPMIGIPAGWMGKVLFQNIGFGSGTLELSTPTVIDII